MEERVKKAERRIKNVEEAILMLTESMLIQDDWWDEYRSNQTNTDVKITALVDAQIRSESEIKEFRQETNEFRRATKQMFNHLIKLIDKMDKRIELLEKKNNNDKKNGKSK